MDINLDFDIIYIYYASLWNIQFCFVNQFFCLFVFVCFSMPASISIFMERKIMAELYQIIKI